MIEEHSKPAQPVWSLAATDDDAIKRNERARVRLHEKQETRAVCSGVFPREVANDTAVNEDPNAVLS